MEFPQQVTSQRRGGAVGAIDAFDMRDALSPRRLTMAMWDQAFVLRHLPGGSYENFDKVLDETVERGYNTVRLDPMPQWIDLSAPDTVLKWADPMKPYLPWDWNTAVEGPVGRWMIEFMEKLLKRPFLHYTLSAWWSTDQRHNPKLLRDPKNHTEGAQMWITMLRQWKSRFGFDHLVYVDLANEVPYFFPGFRERFRETTGSDWQANAVFTPQQVKFIADELNPAMKVLQQEFPELRFTASIHGDVRWIDVPLEVDCLDVHFYADADPRWSARTRFREYMPRLFTDNSFHKDFSDRCTAAVRSAGPMLRARQRAKVAAFAAWAQERGTPLTTSESWSSWYYFDSPNLDWAWLLEWAEWSVQDAIDMRMWGWTPHNYLQPQFANWNDARWHQRLTSRFLQS